jgi:signal transduction histidine kinase
LDKEWTSAGDRRVANYNYIPPGDFVFQVIACNNDGVWNLTGAKIAFTVLPYFWQTLWFRVLGGGLTLVAGGAIAWLDSQRRMRRKVEHLERQSAMERERMRIARDIHDDIGVQLTRIGMLSDPSRIASQDSGRSATDMNRIYFATHHLTRTLDEIVWAVNPHHDTLDSLVNYLHKFAQDFLETAGIRCRLEAPIPLPVCAISGELRHNLFLAFKEALNNVIKHAHATEVNISLALKPGGMALAIQDNGRGFAMAAEREQTGGHAAGREGGNGLKNMKHRMAEVGGDCEITSLPGQGTKVRFELPIKSPAQ